MERRFVPCVAHAARTITQTSILLEDKQRAREKYEHSIF